MHTFKFNNETIEVNFSFHGKDVHISVYSKALGCIEDSSAIGHDYRHMIDATPAQLEQYAINQIALLAYHLTEKMEEIS